MENGKALGAMAEREMKMFFRFGRRRPSASPTMNNQDGF
jgi:hypothetical protein